MFGKHTLQKRIMLAMGATLVAGSFLLAAPQKASADYAPILGETNTYHTPLIPGAQYANQMQPAQPGQPPPIGDGSNPPAEITGDQGQPPAPPTGQADPTTGSIFGTRQAPGPKPPSEYVPNAGRYQTKNGQQQGVYDQAQEELGTKMVNNGGPATGASDWQNNGGPKAGAADTQDTLFTHQIQPNRYDYEGPLPTVRVFCRYLVILGVVAATVWIAMASIGMIMGNSYAGSRAIGAAAGLLLLIAGYTIWKVVQMNTFHGNSTGWEAHYRDGTAMNLQLKNGPAVQNY